MCIRDSPYSISGHTHELEISGQLGKQVRFAPHVADFFRGISVTVNVELNREIDTGTVKRLFEEFYRNRVLVEVTETIPEIRDVAMTNKALVGGFSIDSRDTRRVSLVCVIDNLRKGAASQVVQNLNLMCGLSAEHALNV